MGVRRDWSGLTVEGLHLLQDLADLSVLSLHGVLEPEGSVKNRVGILVGGLRTGVGGGALHGLADDDDAQEDQLQEGLTNPRDDRDDVVGVDGGWERDDSEHGERVHAPHRADPHGDLEGEECVEPGERTLRRELVLDLGGPFADR